MVLILILIDVQYLQINVFYFEKGLNGQMHFSSDPHHLIKKSTPSWKTLGFFWHTVNYTTSGYMLNADGHLMD